MNRRKTLIIGILCLLLVLTVCLPGAHSGVWTTYLDGAWFKLKLTVKGHKFDRNTGAIETYNFQAPVYFHLTWDTSPNPNNNNEPWNMYKCEWWTLQDSGNWLRVYDHVSTLHPGENFIQGKYLWFQFTDQDIIHTTHTPFINIQIYAGGLKKATWDGTGQVLYGLFEGNTKEFYGYFNLKGTTVDPAKLPAGIPH